MDQRIKTEMPKVKRSFYTLVGKRFLDILLSGIAIIVLSPVMIITAILVYIFHGSPVLFEQKRPGKNGKLFKLYKFRSMNNKTDKNGELLPGDQRLTKFGKLIRKLSLDELPELFCILKGDMSIIGPRPLLPQYMSLYTKRHRMRHAVKPGFACVPIKPIKTWTWNDQFENDIYYIENCSLSLDIKMLFAVAREALVGSEYRVNDTREEYNGNNLFSSAK